MEYFSKDDVLNLLNRNSITKKITLADGVSIYDSVKNLPAADVVPKDVLDQVRWERRVAIKQLEEIGLSFGEKTEGYGNLTEYAREIFEEIADLDIQLNNGDLDIKYFGSAIDELKKKYTEGK